MFSIVSVYVDHLKFYVVCINGRRYVCCSECNVVHNECNEPTPALCNLSVGTVVKVCITGVFILYHDPMYQNILLDPTNPPHYMLPVSRSIDTLSVSVIIVC